MRRSKMGMGGGGGGGGGAGKITTLKVSLGFLVWTHPLGNPPSAHFRALVGPLY